MVCQSAYDIDPQRNDIEKADSLTKYFECSDVDYIITNPPWDREIFMPMMEKFMQFRPTWVLIDADLSHTIQNKVSKKIGCMNVPELLKHCKKIVAVGRVKWIKNTKNQGKENAVWMLFDKNHTTYPIFYPKLNNNKKESENGRTTSKRE